jgi:hypothetical protein
MDTEWVRPIVSGILGALLASWGLRRLERYASKADPGFDAESILHRSKIRQRVAACVFFMPIAVGIYLFKAGIVATNSWYVLAAVFGTAVLLPYGYLIVTSFARNAPTARDVLLAQAIKSKTPLWAYFVLIVLAVFCVVVAVTVALG